MSIKPIFLLSLPRSGSTLLQRLLSLNRNVYTKSEPWIALPLFISLNGQGVRAIYGHKTMAEGIKGFVDSFPKKTKDFYIHTSEYLIKLYSIGVKKDAKYFLDKTPRYHLIVDHLFDAFPDAKFIFLWRNPLAISASMINTYGQGAWNLYMFWVDLYSGISSLVNAYKKYENRLISLRYEDLVDDAEHQLIRIMNYLEIRYEKNSVQNLKNAKKMWGDRTGQYKYSSVNLSSKNKWKSILTNPLRKRWANNYLEWIGHERLETMGYDLVNLQSELRSINVDSSFFASDIFRMVYGKVFCAFELGILKDKLKKREFPHCHL